MTIMDQAPTRPVLDLYSLEEAADVLRLSPRQLAGLALRKEIGAVKMGRKWVFRLEDLDEYVDRMAQPARYRMVASSKPQPETAESLKQSVSIALQASPEAHDWGRRTR